MLEWLISRRHCKHEWQPEVVKIRAKINAAIQDMPVHETIATLLSGTYINYFHCLKIIEILEKTEADTKNIFGGYSSKRMKDWQEIVNLYKKNNVYLAEAADLLINTVKYEVPNIKKLIAKQEQLQNELKKKEADAIKSSNTARNDLKAFLKEVGLEYGEGSYRKKLIENARQLNASHEKVVQATRDILPAIEHYTNFTAISLPQHTVNLNLVKYIAEKGNTTVYEWEHGEAPSQINLPPTVFTEDEPEQTEDGIDWGTDGITSIDNPREDTIDWGIDMGPSSESNPEIEVLESSSNLHSSEQFKQKESTTEKVAYGDKALNLLDNMNTRTNFINQLLELRSFLKMRLIEAQKDGPIDDLVESVSSLQEMHAGVDSIICLLLSKTSQHFYNILYLPKYLDGLVTKLNEKEDSIERWLAIAALSKERAVEAVAESASLSAKAQVMIKKAKELQDEIKKDISARYNGRMVTLMGGPSL